MSLTIRTDVTAVKLYKNYVLAGIGSYVNIFEKESTRLVQRIEALRGQKIYGFVILKCESKIIVFGGKQFSIISASNSELECIFYRIFEPVLCDDWLHSGLWIDGKIVAFLTAHNVVQKWNTQNQQHLSSHCSKENSILYSGLLVPANEDMIVLAGTVFSEVIINWCGDDEPLHRLKGHRGVIFSISCNTEKGIIVTTSDDRSVRIWSMVNIGNHPQNSITFWKNISIECQQEVYGHLARVMRSFITDKYIISVGEDAAICFWNLEGGLAKKISSHQNACIWAVDADEEYVVTGGGDSGIYLHPILIASEYGDKDVLEIAETPKKILFSARNNIILLNENDELLYYIMASKSKMIYKLEHESTYKLMTISSCKQIIAVADMKGKLDIFIENCKEEAYLLKIIDTKLQIGKILSMHWAGNRQLVFCSDDGEITVLTANGSNTEVYANFKLPSCKERWLTNCATDPLNKYIICGDRNGNIHCYIKGQKDPIKTFKKVHGRYGPTSIKVGFDQIVSTGRDGTIKYFAIKEDLALTKYMTSKELEFEWVERFLDKKESLVCGFQERVFVVYNIEKNTKLLEVPCGGGHRSWDAVRCFEKMNDKHEEFVKLIYIKNSNVHIASFQMNKIVSKAIINGSHAKEINCLKTYQPDVNSPRYYISGGEDTTLRISSMDSEFKFQDEVILKHLSNIRTLKVYPVNENQLLVVSGGGRAQICINRFTFDKLNGDVKNIKVTNEKCIDYLLKGSDDERKHNKNWKVQAIDFDPETRVMDIDAISINNNFYVFAGCSDALLRIFIFANDTFKIIKSINYHKTCILKTQHIKIFDKDFIVTCSTRGEVVFWNVIDKNEDITVENIFCLKTGSCGINSFDYYYTSENTILIATGGDDNAISLNLLKIENSGTISFSLQHKWSSNNFHCSQITGIILLKDILISTSIDQRVTVCRWNTTDNGIECEFLTQCYSDVADVQGLDLIKLDRKSITVCVFGKGIEVLKIDVQV